MQPLEPDDPQTIGAYRLLRRLGSGGMGRVYLARSASGRTVAVKVVHPHFVVDELFRERFRREVAAARRVGDQWTAPVLDADPDARVPWVATGFVAGPPLQQAVAEYGPLPEASVRALGAGLAEALAHVHGLGLVHRDVKPSNVLLTPEGPCLIDFGIARATDATASLTSTGVSIGSPGYMSPEQVLGEELSYPSDVFSLGAVLAYAAMGNAPFPGDSSASLLYKVVHEEPELGGVGEELRELLARCLAKDAAQRPGPELIAGTLAGPGGAAGLVGAGWLPGRIVERVGRQAVELLSLEPEVGTGTDGGPGTGSAPGPVSGPLSGAEQGPGSGPVPFTTPAQGPGGAAVPASGVFGPPDPSFGAADGTGPWAGGLQAQPSQTTGAGNSPAHNPGSASPSPSPSPNADPDSSPNGAPPPSGKRRQVSCTLVLSVACVAAAALTGTYFLGLFPGARGDADSPTAPGPSHSAPGTGAGQQGGAHAVPKPFIGRWEGQQAYTDNGVTGGKVSLTFKQGAVGARIGHSKATLSPLPSCGGALVLKSASPKKLVVRSVLTQNSSLCRGGTEEYTLRGDGTLYRVTKYPDSNVKGPLHKLK